MLKKMKTICIAGKNEIAVNAVKYLADNYPNFKYCIICNRTETGIPGWQPSLSFTAKSLNIPEVSLSDLYDIENLVFISLEFDSIIKPSLFKKASFFNIHFSALPKFKGMYTSVLPILHGESSSGVTLHQIDKGIDTGDIIDQIIFPIDKDVSCRDLYQLYLDNSFILLKKNIKSILDDNYKLSRQSIEGSSYFSKKEIDFTNLKLDLNKTAAELRNQVRAFTFREYQLLKYANWNIYKTEISETKSTFKAGTLLEENDAFFLLSTIDYNIKLYKDYYDILWTASKQGDYEKVLSVIDYIPDLNLRNVSGWNALILSVYNNHQKIVKLLIQHENNVNIQTSNYKGTTLIMYAFTCYKNTGDDTMLKLIRSYSPDLNVKDIHGLTLFDYVKNDETVLNLLK